VEHHRSVLKDLKSKDGLLQTKEICIIFCLRILEVIVNEILVETIPKVVPIAQENIVNRVKVELCPRPRRNSAQILFQ
jgi:hypothetical protein